MCSPVSLQYLPLERLSNGCPAGFVCAELEIATLARLPYVDSVQLSKLAAGFKASACRPLAFAAPHECMQSPGMLLSKVDEACAFWTCGCIDACDASLWPAELINCPSVQPQLMVTAVYTLPHCTSLNVPAL